MSGRYAAGEKVLFVNENAGGHLVGIVLEEVGKGIKVKTTSGNKDKILIVPFKNILRDCPVQKKVDVDNMILLTDLSAFTILENLKYRYYNSKIYLFQTYIGNIVITVNPYKDLLIDGPEVMLHYFNHLMSAVPPHLYGLAELIYQAAVQDEQNQVVIISGESGSGKTEAFKRITRYLAVASEPRATSMSSVARRVLDSTPVLESFGNATTLRNDNSSRFGKYVEIYFAKLCEVCQHTTRLQARCDYRSEKERNYHVFYEFLSSLDNSNKQLHHLQSVEDYDYLVHVSLSK
ncbi:hypothetical protein AHF37_03338 [Paragonimus kellicotti]|nr:hypothetical protein AHF37_03338 [Paragonimus kellicotti]